MTFPRWKMFLAGVVFCAMPATQAAIITFETDGGRMTPFSSGGASFITPGYSVQNNAAIGTGPVQIFTPVGFDCGTVDCFNNGNFLFPDAGSLLDIDFVPMITDFSVKFAISTGGPEIDPLINLQLTVGSTTVTAPLPLAELGNYRFGTLQYSSAIPFNAVHIAFVPGPAATMFAIDNVTFTPADTGVPEPATTALVGIGLTTLALVARRRL